MARERQARRAAIRPGPALAAALAVAAAAWAPAGGQGSAGAAPEADVVAWAACRTRTEALAVRLDSLVAREVLAWEERRSAIASAAGGEERRALARGEALGDTLRAVADALHASDRECRRVAEELLVRVEREIDALGPVGEGGRADSLRDLRGRLVTARAARRGADLTAPIARPEDGPDVLRLKAARARDLADRAAAWRADVGELRRATEDRQRLAAERHELLGDLSFFNAGAALDPGGGASRDLAPDEAAPTDSSAVARLLQALLAGGGVRAGGVRSPLEALAALESWLAQKESELAAQAVELDSLAARWGREP